MNDLLGDIDHLKVSNTCSPMELDFPLTIDVNAAVGNFDDNSGVGANLILAVQTFKLMIREPVGEPDRDPPEPNDAKTWKGVDIRRRSTNLPSYPADSPAGP